MVSLELEIPSRCLPMGFQEAHKLACYLGCCEQCKHYRVRWRTWWHAQQHDSVEYASVRSSSERVPPAPPPEMPPQAPLFDVPTLVRLQQLQENAPLLYPAPSPEFPNYRAASEPIDQRLSVDHPVSFRRKLGGS